MEIIKYQKIGKNKYKVYFEKTELILYEDLILKYGLLNKRDIDIETLNNLIKENVFYEAYDLALGYIVIKLRTKKEIKKYLENRNFEVDLINKVVSSLEQNGYLNDKKYVTAFVNDRINLSSYGPFRIKSELMMADIDELTIDEYLDKIDDKVWISRINRIIEKKLHLNNNKSSKLMIEKLKTDLFNLGYQTLLIENSLRHIEIIDDEQFNKEYLKAKKKFERKYSGNELYYKIYNYLYKKGFSADQIKSILD